VPSSLFAVSVFNLGYTRTVYAPASDGKRFLVNSLVTEQVSSPISVLVNWTAGLKR
jgi:hypothetical protein